MLSGSGLEIASVTSAGFVSGIYDEKLERHHLSLFSWSAVMSSLQLRKCSLTRAISTCKFLPSLVFKIPMRVRCIHDSQISLSRLVTTKNQKLQSLV